MANAESDPVWDNAAWVTQQWLRLSPDELQQLADEVIEVILRWSSRATPDDGVEREPVFLFARAFPAQP